MKPSDTSQEIAPPFSANVVRSRMDRDVMYALMDRVLRIGKKSPQRFPGRFSWKFRDDRENAYALKVGMSAPIAVDGVREFEVEYEVLSPKVKTPMGTVTIRDEGRIRKCIER